MVEREEQYRPDDLIAEARRQRVQAETTAALLDDAAFTRRPTPDRWSVSECFEHLALINEIYLDAIADAVARAPGGKPAAEGAKRARRHGWLGDAFVRSLEPPPRLKGGAFKATIPTRSGKAEVLPRFLAQQDRLIRVVTETRDLDYARVRLRSPFFKLLRLSLGQAFGAILAHNRRHIWQAEGVHALLRTNPQDRS